MRAAAYVRISVDRPEETSTTSQAAKCRDYAESRGWWDFVGTYEDKGRSAYKSDSNRPALKRLLADAEAGLIDVVVVWRLDRFSRSVVQFSRMWERLQKADTDFVSVMENFDTTTAMGKAMLQIAVVFAELESGIKSERISAWHEQRNAQGLPPTAHMFGYDSDWNPIPEEADRISDAVDRILDGESIRSVLREWRDDEIPTRRGNLWSRRGFTMLLRSPSLAGLRDLDGTLVEGQWEPIVDRERWDRLQTLLLDPKRNRNTNRSARVWLLGGIAHCGECGSPMSGRGHSAGPRYVCKPYMEIDGCGRISIAVDMADVFAVDALFVAVGDGLPEVSIVDPGEVARLETELTELAWDYGAGSITRQEWTAARAGIEARLKDATERQARAGSIILPSNLADVWDDLDLDRKRSAILSVIERIDVAPIQQGASKTDRLSIVWRT